MQLQFRMHLLKKLLKYTRKNNLQTTFFYNIPACWTSPVFKFLFSNLHEDLFKRWIFGLDAFYNSIIPGYL